MLANIFGKLLYSRNLFPLQQYKTTNFSLIFFLNLNVAWFNFIHSMFLDEVCFFVSKAHFNLPVCPILVLPRYIFIKWDSLFIALFVTWGWFFMKNMASAIPPPLLSLLHAQRAVALEQLPKPPHFYFHSALVKRAEEDMWLTASASHRVLLSSWKKCF